MFTLKKLFKKRNRLNTCYMLFTYDYDGGEDIRLFQDEATAQEAMMLAIKETLKWLGGDDKDLLQSSFSENEVEIWLPNSDVRMKWEIVEAVIE